MANVVPIANAAPTVFPRKEYKVTDTGMQLFCCLTCPIHWMPIVPGILGEKRIVLEEEEAVMTVNCGICNAETRRPYGELGSVDKGNYCCCYGVASDLTKSMPICPGMGCDEAFVDEIVADLKRRMKSRGDTGQIQRAEQMLIAVQNVGADVRVMQANIHKIMEHLKLEPVQPGVQVMNRDGGGGEVGGAKVAYPTTTDL